MFTFTTSLPACFFLSYTLFAYSILVIGTFGFWFVGICGSLLDMWKYGSAFFMKFLGCCGCSWNYVGYDGTWYSGWIIYSSLIGIDLLSTAIGENGLFVIFTSCLMLWMGIWALFCCGKFGLPCGNCCTWIGIWCCTCCACCVCTRCWTGFPKWCCWLWKLFSRPSSIKDR